MGYATASPVLAIVHQEYVILGCWFQGVPRAGEGWIESVFFTVHKDDMRGSPEGLSAPPKDEQP